MDHRYDDNNIEGPVLTAEPGLIDIEELENHNRAWDNVILALAVILTLVAVIPLAVVLVVVAVLKLVVAITLAVVPASVVVLSWSR